MEYEYKPALNRKWDRNKAVCKKAYEGLGPTALAKEFGTTKQRMQKIIHDYMDDYIREINLAAEQKKDEKI